jgi:hypothetical protein
MSAPFIGFKQYFVGEQVQFFLNLTLNILAACAAQHLAERAFAYRMADGLTGTRKNLYQQSQFGRDAVMQTLLFDQILGKADSLHSFSFE